jgi:hypothetical protein
MGVPTSDGCLNFSPLPSQIPGREPHFAGKEAAMLNEGTIANDTSTLVKTEMLQQLWKTGRTTPDRWEQLVFYALTGYTRHDIDWSVEDNQAGYYTWLRSFDQLIEELIEDGYVEVKESEGRPYLVAREADLPFVPSQRKLE